MKLALIVCLALGLSAPAHADVAPATARHLLAGVRAFQQGHYDEALVELRVVARASDAPADLAFYLGPTLYKLGRYREALEVFVTSRAARDALTDFYLGETYYRLQLFRKARDVFAHLQTRGLGPVLEAAAARYIATIDAAYQGPPADGTVAFYVAQGRALLATDPVVAAEYLDEARLVDGLAALHPARAELDETLAAAWNAIGRAHDVVDLLASVPSPSLEARWQLGRAYAALADAAHARELLGPIASAGGAHAAEAATLLAKLPP